MKRSTSSLVRSTMSVTGPDTLQESMLANGVGAPPSCRSTTIARTPCSLRSSAAYLFAVSASSRNSTFWIAEQEDEEQRESRRDQCEQRGQAGHDFNLNRLRRP